MSHTETVVASRGILYHNRKVLFVRQVSGEWVIPGGGLEKGETTRDCVMREFMEEVGLKVKIVTPLYFDEFKNGGRNCLALYYFVKMEEDVEQEMKVKPEDDIVNAKWFTRKKIQSMDVVWPREIKDVFWDVNLPYLVS